MDKFIVSNQYYTISDIIAGMNKTVVLSEESRANIQKGRDFLEHKIADSKDPIYGINTGFGSLCNTSINPEMLSELQVNLVRSHACGVGETVSKTISQLIFLLKIIGLSKGNSGVRVALIDHMISLYNLGAFPVVYEFGSLGASGDLAPLAHLALTLIGEGEIWGGDQKIAAKDWYANHNISPIVLASKEGISLLNGTQFMSAFGVYGVHKFRKILNASNHAMSVSLEAFSGSLAPFIDELHAVRKNEGQRYIASEIRRITAGSESLKVKKNYVQDPYSFRCTPQVHGASYVAMEHVAEVVENEINAVTDNPTLLFEEDTIVSGGNFHGQPLALSYEYACMATAEIGSISERRVYKLLAGERGLPAFLVNNPGINSGFMIPQYTAASLVNRNKQLCAPSVVDTIDSSNGQEDHVSMGANVATKWNKILENVLHIISIELLVGFQALDFGQPSNVSPVLEKMYISFRSKVPFIVKDEVLFVLIKDSLSFTKEEFDLYL